MSKVASNFPGTPAMRSSPGSQLRAMPIFWALQGKSRVNSILRNIFCNPALRDQPSADSNQKQVYTNRLLNGGPC
jgi:hypothetical protein